jgi:hypothetical protein
MTRHSSAGNEIVVDRRNAGRRATADRRRGSAGEARPQGDARPTESRQLVERQSERRKVERRRQIDPTTCERDYTPDQVDFMKAMDLYKRRSGRQFPTWSEVLEVIEHLGYRKVAPPTEIYKRTE